MIAIIFKIIKNMIDALNFSIFEKEFQYGAWIEKSLNNDNSIIDTCLFSRIKAIFISVLALGALVADAVYIGYHTLLSLGYAVTHFKSPLTYPSNTRIILLVFGECIRHILGVLFGTILGLISPQNAKDYFLPHDQSSMDVIMTKEEAAKLYAMMQIIDALFEANGIEYRATGGTQLGITRKHKGIIPNDDDIDIAVDKESKDKIFKLKEELEKKGLGIIESNLGFKIHDLFSSKKIDNDLGCKESYGYPFVDVCFFEQIDDKVVYSNETFRTHFAGEFFTLDDWKAQEKIAFGPIFIYALAKERGVEFCKRAYTEKCFKYSYRVYNHKSNGLCCHIEIPQKLYFNYGDKNCLTAIEYDQMIFQNAFPDKKEKDIA